MRTGCPYRIRTRVSRLVAAGASLSLLAAACGGGTSGAGHSAPGATASPAANLTPKPGGSLIVGTEAEVDGFDTTKNRWAASGYLYGLTVFDPLVTQAADGSFKPDLAQSLTPNTDFTQWTIKLRPNIKFSDGEPFNADVVKKNLDAHRKSLLTGNAISDIASVDKVDDLTVSVTMAKPWSVFPTILASQIGYMMAPKMMDDPNGSRNPIGTGPFIMKEWVPGNHFIATKNPNYWRPGLPYLDSVEFRPIVDAISRENSLKAGTIDMMHTTDAQTIVDFRADKAVHLLEQTTGRVEEDFVMLNTSKAPLDDIRIRQALAYGLDRSRYNQLTDNGIFKLASGPFSDGSGFDNAPGYPSYDPAKAKELVKQYEQAKGVSKVSFSLGTTPSPKNLQQAQLIADMWSQIGIDVKLTQVDQSQFILNALLGNYDAYNWRQFGESDPDYDAVWWSSANARPDGQIALNFARNKDPKIDQDLQDARSTLDQARRRADYTDISAQFNKDLPYIWEVQVEWAYAAKPDVMGIDTPTLPDGGPARGLASGAFELSQIWLNK